MSNLKRYISEEDGVFHKVLVQEGEPVSYLAFKEEIDGKFFWYINCLKKAIATKLLAVEDLVEKYNIDYYSSDFDRVLMKDIGIKELMWMSDKGTKFTLPKNCGISYSIPNYSFNNPNTIKYEFLVSYTDDLPKEVRTKLRRYFKAIFERAISIINGSREYPLQSDDDNNKYILKTVQDFTIYLKLDLDTAKEKNNMIAIELVVDCGSESDEELDEELLV